MENLNSGQIKKGLKICAYTAEEGCDGCPHWDETTYKDTYKDCRTAVCENALALINSQEQRIKELETRLCHLLQSKTIAKYDEVNIHTKEYLKDIHSLDANIDHLNEQHKLLEAEIERLENICDSYFLQYGTAADKEIFLKETKLTMENKRTLAEIGIGETCRIGEREYIVCEHTAEGSVLLMRDCLYDREKFGVNNNYNGSNVDKLCEEFADEIEKDVGAEDIVPHVVDLTADDGLRDYGTIERRVSLFTANQYRKYCDILDKYRLDKWTWTATAYSTPRHDDDAWVKCVSPLGIISISFSRYDGNGVRPFLILKSSIFVS